MALSKTLYKAIFRRSSTFAVAIVVSAVFFERVFDQGGDALFEYLNRGKLWKHIKHNYTEKTGD
ncbi:cytochrome b-c1 complex subunit 9 [Austrofundulus limnaeus]|uniref:Complex III subunit 9 n=1 Tax=Austrofundulus limnaeus TaxID=52670 RepID=A0A2I4AUN8_AUSLI|nr:PREDICTED: cytochrome b-c1 complex subunit 9 [Austrofundulus limnaeus]